MVASPVADRKESAQVPFFRARKTRRGYFVNENIWQHLGKHMGLVTKFYSDDDHVFVVDNVITLLKYIHVEDRLRLVPWLKNSGNLCTVLTVTQVNSRGRRYSGRILTWVRKMHQKFSPMQK